MKRKQGRSGKQSRKWKVGEEIEEVREKAAAAGCTHIWGRRLGPQTVT